MTSQSRKITSAEKDARAVALRAEGYNLDAISERLGYASRASAWKAVERGLARVPEPAVTQLRAVQDAALDRAQQVTFDILTDAETSHDTRLKAVLAVVRVLERRAKLHGLDAPSELRQGGNPFVISIDPNLLPENANLSSLGQRIEQETFTRKALTE